MNELEFTVKNLENKIEELEKNAEITKGKVIEMEKCGIATKLTQDHMADEISKFSIKVETFITKLIQVENDTKGNNEMRKTIYNVAVTVIMMLISAWVAILLKK